MALLRGKYFFWNREFGKSEKNADMDNNCASNVVLHLRAWFWVKYHERIIPSSCKNLLCLLAQYDRRLRVSPYPDSRLKGQGLIVWRQEYPGIL
ncbi:hypothetical protein UWK_00949 [Desulfocapsa sulfexigens DSM 10523]|uniref:Uncharacterized protein n=1 Tax=Desulfocapsa sulfexigens (strain DSM 10523 / SB164P1) TaxID=1167006 RepID=M1P227_DESSD|nr:hypothetical protein UWK_00949 [Desulfocapsa sulfexigens DSM 10523]